MNLKHVHVLVERLRKEAIGEPKWIEEKEVYEYQDHSATVVAILKIIRAAQGVTALNLLCQSGLFIDFGAIIRCVNDCADEVYFLLEDFPRTSGNVDQFVKSFFESTIDGHLSHDTPAVPTKKIRSAMVRVLKGSHDERTRAILENIYKTFFEHSAISVLHAAAFVAHNLGLKELHHDIAGTIRRHDLA
jgi:hypothetical protein